MEKGRIIKALSGFYYVENDEGVFQCRARGVFRKRKIVPLVGDTVMFEAANKTEGYIMEVKERSNELVRPPIANVEQAVLVFSVADPVFHPLLLDRMLVHVESRRIEPLICFSKLDLADPSVQANIARFEQWYKEIGYQVLKTSIYTEETLKTVYPYLENKVTVLAGQSGVGKSSLLNALKPGLNIKTDETSKSLGRGKHTTKHVELIPLENGGYVADTPGFSSLDFTGIEAEELTLYFPEMEQRREFCKFRGCLHVNEPSCAVKTAVRDGEVAQHRYDHYLQFIEEIQQTKRRY
ncbi:ribosome small subunit-dependent GTPase A [Salisediminibacterium halotolerans]|uniref:Small ribosomal subunit biogenesis GTPase RsgA n=1 Tax=Salisediminibacterium halotolerans TaxID=517425 RepID=A0A1H9PY50_9BACI|nr:ribosome small subunit-dependent GTPase A [Salisediminibacterium haloalkalitolerans]SER53114.1 ribosome biogenesis GTPase [Salisediminibacterium haloalkalitolerans]